MQRFRGRPSRALATVLFTDIVGSTTRAAELGDARWQALLSRHHELVRRLLRRYRGREIDTAGDGFFAVFDNPAQAVGCATTLRDKVRALGIEIRAGVHTGEVEQSGASIRGIAVHLGARIMSVAGPSEVLVSSTVRELTAGSDFTFTDRGSHQLKGVPDARRLFAVEPAADVRSELPAVTGAPATTVGTHATPRPRIGKVMLVALLSLSALGIVVAMWAVGQLSPARPAAFVDPAPNTLARLDLGSGQSRDALRVASGPVAVVATVEGLWVASAGERRVTLANASTGGTMVVPHDVGAASGIAVGAETVWIPDALGGGLTVLRRPDGAFRKLIGDAGSGESVWVDDRAAWSTDEVGGAIVGIDPETLQVTARISVLSGPADLAIADGVAWVTDRYDRWLTRVPLDGGPQRRIPVQARLSSVVIDGNDVWATSETGDALIRIDRVTVSVRETIPLADGPDALLVTPDGLWVALRESRAVVRLDRALAEVGRYDLAGIPSDLALLDGVVWVTIEAP